ncbi:MAG: hypothetical protein HN348_36810 [Proteobacteria bacterium]|nr:hypothetical protein [Pseudomonadota bacterium]
MIRKVLFCTAIFSTGCAEHWYADDDEELCLVVPETGIVVQARVHTTPAAFPNDRYDEALRLTFEGAAAELKLEDPGYDELRLGPASLNVLDAWDDCDLETCCEKVFTFRLTCTDTQANCAEPGLLTADAFLATYGVVPEEHRGGYLDLELVVPETTSTIY